MNKRVYSTYLAIAASALLFTACSNDSGESSTNQTNSAMTKINYPATAKGEVVDTYFDQQIADPYRWLEDDRSAETEAWVAKQNTVTFDYLKQIPYRDKLEQRLTELWNYEKVGSPFSEGQYTYFYKNDGLQNQYVVYRQKQDGEAEVFLDPNTFSEDGTTSLASLSFSKDGSIAAYAISEGGSDWRKIIIIDAETKTQLEEPLKDVKFSGISWFGNQGFYYSSYDKPEGSELSAKTDQHKLYYHALGQPQQQDAVIFGASAEEKHRYVGGYVTEDDNYLLISASESTSGNDLYLKDLSKADSKLVTIIESTSVDTDVIDNVGSKLLMVTNQNAPNKKVVAVDAKNPATDQWQTLIPETENVLTVTTGGGAIFAEYMVNATSKVFQYNYQGEKTREIPLSGLGSAGGLSGKKHEADLYYTFTNYITPPTIFKLNVASGNSEIYRKSGAKINSAEFVSEQVFYTSKDGTQVPMIITHKKGLKRDGNNPTILYGYGGFNVSLTPSFSITNTVWMENGGILAVPNLRGGGEYGKQWHQAGIQLNKQNVFDDFIAAAEYLVAEKYTSKKYLAIRGGSNGGLLVGAVMTQRPDLVQVALPAVGVLDMLRYHTFTSGAGWAYDYGTSEQSAEMFNYLKGYSPVHNVRDGASYPATMVTTGDHDDRVVPAHSFKFAAELQAKQSGLAPTLIRIETNAGHGAGTPVSKTIDLYADIFGFTLYNMGIKKL